MATTVIDLKDLGGTDLAELRENNDVSSSTFDVLQQLKRQPKKSILKDTRWDNDSSSTTSESSDTDTEKEQQNVSLMKKSEDLRMYGSTDTIHSMSPESQAIKFLMNLCSALHKFGAPAHRIQHNMARARSPPPNSHPGLYLWA